MSKELWNNLFKNRKIELPPEDYLVKNIDLLKTGRILDLACGDGRNTLFLADCGFEVTAADFSETGLEKIQQKKLRNVKTVLGDANDPEFLKGLGMFDSIVVNHFVPSPKILNQFSFLLNENGTAMIIAFDEEMEKVRPDRKDLILYAEKFETAVKGLEILKKDSFTNANGSFYAYLLQKTSSESLRMCREYLGKAVSLIIDQPYGTFYEGTEYELNYGYIPGTSAPDGAGLDAYLLSIKEPLKNGRGKCIAVLHRLFDDDDKLIMSPDNNEFTDEEIEHAVVFREKLFPHCIIRK